LRTASVHLFVFGTLFDPLRQDLIAVCNPQHPGPGLWPERVCLIGRSAQHLGAAAQVRSVLDGPNAHHGRLNVIAAADAIIATAKTTGMERKLMEPYSSRPFRSRDSKMIAVLWFQSGIGDGLMSRGGGFVYDAFSGPLSLDSALWTRAMARDAPIAIAVASAVVGGIGFMTGVWELLGRVIFAP
jgi:hypothetical protein